MTADITKDTVWGPQGSPYVVSGSVYVMAALTLLPGTVVKLDRNAQMTTVERGQLASLGTPGRHVVITSFRDDSVMGDTNGDGSATAPAKGDWQTIYVSGYPTQPADYNRPASVFDYTDVRYGGGPSDVYGCRAGAVTAMHSGVRLIVANSSFTDVVNAAVAILSVVADDRTRVGVYDSTFARVGCAVGEWNTTAPVDVVGNTLTGPFDHNAITAVGDQQHIRVWYNTNQGSVLVDGAGHTLTRAQADVRYNALLGGISDTTYPLLDWSGNWYGQDANQPLPPCLDSATAGSYVPALLTTSSTASSTAGGICPTGQVTVTGYKQPVLPALSASLQVLPQSLRDAAAPRLGVVDTYSGALMYTADDVTVHDAGQDIAFGHAYRSDKPGAGDVGTGWSTSYSESLAKNGAVATLNFGNGQGVDFTTDPAAGYTPAPGVAAGYSTGDSGTTVTTADQSSYQFDASGQLTAQTVGDDAHQLTIERSGGQVSRVTGVSGRYLSYDRGGGKIDKVSDGTGRSVQFSYDSGRLTSVTNVDGKTETYGYDSAGRLTSVTTPMGKAKLSAGYDGQSRVAWVEQDGTGRSTISYDDAHGTRTITLADGTVRTQEYDFAGRLVTEHTGSTGRHVVYDGEGHVVATIGGVPDVPMTGYAPAVSATMFDKNSDAVVTVDAMGMAIGTTYNSRHQPLVDSRSDGTTVNRTYDDHWRLTQVADPSGQTWKYTYNGWGEVSSQTDPLGRTRTVAYAGNGDPSSLTDETGGRTTFGYDPQGRRTSVTDALGEQTVTSYTASDQLSQTKQPRGGTTSTAFNDDGRRGTVTDAVGAVTTYEYDGADRLTTTVNAAGGRTTYSYDTLGRLVSITDPRGAAAARTYSAEGWIATATDRGANISSYSYDPAGRILRVTDPLGQITQSAYNRDGAVTDTWTPDGAHTSQGYDVMGRHTTSTNGLGGVTTLGYDANGRQASAKDPLGYLSKVAYDTAGRLTSRTDPAGATTTYSYDDAHRTVTATDSLGTVEIATRDAAGRVVSHADGTGAVTTYAYDADGDQTGLTTPAGTTTTEYDLAGRTVAVTDPVGRRTVTTRDPLGRVTGHSYPDTTSDTLGLDADGNITSFTDRAGAAWTATYDPNNLLLTTTNPLHQTTRWTYDPLGRQTSVTDPTGVAQFTAYDPVGRVAVTWDAANASWVTTYDADGNILTASDPDAVKSTYAYDKRDGLTSVTRPAPSGTLDGTWVYAYDPDGRLTSKRERYTTQYEYDRRGRTTAQVNGAGERTTYTYDGAGHRTSATTPGGHTSTWTFDPAGRLTTSTDPMGDTASYGYNAADELTTQTLPRGGIYAYTYDGAGRMASQTGPLGAVTQYGHDGNGNPTTVTYPSGRTVTATYDPAGRQTSVSAAGVTRNLGYDDAGRLTSAAISVTGPTTATPNLSYGYDNRGLLTQSTDNFGTTTWTYDPAHRPITVTPPTGTPSTYTYNDWGQLDTVRGSANIDYTYNLAGQVTYAFVRSARGTFITDRSYDGAGRPTSLSDFGYNAALTYTPDGQVASATEGSKVTTYTYDNAGRLTSNAVTNSGTAVSSATYTWDADSNRTGVTTAGQPTVTATFDAADRQTSSSDGSSDTYDTDGNQTTAGPNTYTYDGFGQVASVTANGTTATYARDPLGRMAARTTGGNTQAFSYLAQTSQIAAAQAAGGPVTNLVRTPDGRLLAQATTGANPQDVGTNFHGDTVALSDDKTWARTWQTSYDPFGTPVAPTGAAPVPTGYQGQYTDPVAGTVDMAARTYDPSSGRFTSPDTIAGSAEQPASQDRYLYGNADPIDNIDPTGHFSWSDLWNDATSFWHDVTTDWNDITSMFASDPAPTERLVTSSGADASSDPSSSNYRAPAPPKKKNWWNSWGSKVVSIGAGIVVGAIVFAGCEALTDGLLTPACGIVAGMAGGAVMGAMDCPAGTSRWECAGKGAIVGGTAAAVFELGGAVGLGPILSGCAGGATAAAASDTSSQSMAIGCGLGGAGGAVAGAIRAGADDPASAAPPPHEPTRSPVDDQPVSSPHTGPTSDGPPADPTTTPTGKTPTADPAGDAPAGTKAYDWAPGNRPGLDTEPQGALPSGSSIGRGQTPDEGEYHYVVMKDGSLRAMNNDDMFGLEPSAGHTSLAGNQSVHMAGTFDVDVAGQITRFDNWSGHYGPQNMDGYTLLEDIARAAFEGHGLPAPAADAWEYHAF